MVPFLGNSLFGIKHEISFAPGGSGDATVNYIQLFIFFVLATAGTLLWTLADKKRAGYDKPFHYFIIICRYYLGSTLIAYGWQKVFHLQMSHLPLGQLLQPVGDQSPFSLAWNFIGYSDLYSGFSGWAEVVSGLLLLFRRTALLGALCSMAVMINVMMMNFSYDIPVKIYSTFLVLLSLVVMSPYMRNLLNLFILQKSVDKVEYMAVFSNKKMVIVRYLAKGFMLIACVAMSFYEAYSMNAEYGEAAPKPPLYGIYKTNQFILNNDTLPLYTDSSAWKTITFNDPGFITIQKFNDKRYGAEVMIDTLLKNMQIKFMHDSLHLYNFNYSQLNDSIYKFAGVSNKDTLEILCKKLNRTNFRLYKTGFNWIHENH
ncbi:MAG: hypothetical protein JWO32_2573 [Bacteroidetes bacterium]|nr:hypothetical protein [Bacteroidota bacterium]